jgi:hypothetical protein
VNHAEDEYVRGDVHTNTVENYFSILKRGIIGTYHHVGKKHLHRYLAEFDRRYNTRTKRGVNDQQRTEGIIKSAEGRRLTPFSPEPRQRSSMSRRTAASRILIVRLPSRTASRSPERINVFRSPAPIRKLSRTSGFVRNRSLIFRA